MTFALTVFTFAAVLLALRAVGMRMLPREELEKLEAVKCPVCRTNLQTITLIYVLVKGIASLARKLAKHTHRRAVEKVNGIHKTFRVNH
jgi:hypothetical protein